jgi:hypothetical protein
MANPTLTNLGHKVTSRDLNWLDLCTRAWGAEFNAPDHGVYEFSNGRKYDSTDKNLTGIYGVQIDIMLEADTNYPDMDASFQREDTQDRIATDTSP